MTLDMRAVFAVLLIASAIALWTVDAMAFARVFSG